jgi:redox-sensitive bicupin YhaK (pirin superfamily)
LFVLKGRLRVGNEHVVCAAELAVFERAGGCLRFDTLEDATVLLLAGEPISEPIVGRGPFVMNSEAEIRQAINDFKNGRFGQMG